MGSYVRRSASALFVLSVLWGQVALAQAGRGTIRGQILDTTGAPLSGVHVTTIATDTGVTTSGISDDRGLYTIVNLPVGRYEVTYRHDGFAPLVVQDVTVAIESALRLDATLRLGALTDTVTVTAERAPLDSRSSATGTTLQQDVV